MNRQKLQKLARQRLREAHALLSRNLYPGSYYLIGYSIECALKACIAKQTKRHDFPDKKRANEAYTHELESLMKLSGLKLDLEEDMKINKDLENNWLVVKDWRADARYDLSITKLQAKDLYSACTARKNGIIPWIKKRW